MLAASAPFLSRRSLGPPQHATHAHCNTVFRSDFRPSPADEVALHGGLRDLRSPSGCNLKIQDSGQPPEAVGGGVLWLRYCRNAAFAGPTGCSAGRTLAAAASVRCRGWLHDHRLIACRAIIAGSACLIGYFPEHRFYVTTRQPVSANV